MTYSGGGLDQVESRSVELGATSMLVPWLNFPSGVANPSLVIDTAGRTAKAEWGFFFGQASTVALSEDLSTWELEDDGFSESSGKLKWSTSWEVDEPRRFWAMRSWSHDE